MYYPFRADVNRGAGTAEMSHPKRPFPARAGIYCHHQSEEDRKMERYYDIPENGYSVRCKLYAGDIKAARRAVVFGHGFGGHKANRAAERFAKHMIAKHPDTAVITFNWPCHGDDMHRRLRLSDCDAYLGAVVRDARERLGITSFCGYAASFGAFLFLHYIASHENPFSRLALRCPAIDMYSVLTEHIMTEENLEDMNRGRDVMVGFDRKIRLDRTFFDEVQSEAVKDLDFTAWMDDILILHGTEDTIVPFSMAQAFADNNLIELVPIEGADHRFIDSRKMDLANAMIIRFFETDA